MIKLKTAALQPGMRVGKPITLPNGSILLGRGSRLTEQHIQRLVSLQVPEILIMQSSDLLPPAPIKSLQKPSIATNRTSVSRQTASESMSEMLIAKSAAPLKCYTNELKRRFDEVIFRLYPDASKQLKQREQLAGIYAIAMEQEELIRMMMLIQIRNKELLDHMIEVSGYALQIGIAMKLEEEQLDDLAIASLVYDIGMILGPVDLFNTDSRSDTFKNHLHMHPVRGYEHLLPLFGEDVADVARSHHERLDGSGYPRKLSGTTINYLARIVAVADVFTALQRNRPWRQAYDSRISLEYIASLGGIQYDGDMASILLALHTSYPVGTMVMLSNGVIAMVTNDNPSQPLCPVVCPVSNESGTWIEGKPFMISDTSELKIKRIL